MIVSIDRIIVGERLRQDNGDITDLARSIKEHGLLHPIVIDANYNLVAGGRRLMAVKENGQTEIEAKMLGELSQRELRILELEENIKRKDLTEIEKSRNLVELGENTKSIIQDERSVMPEYGKTPASGRPPKDEVALNDIAERIGVPRQTIQAAQQHVAAVDEFPVLEPLPKQTAMETAKALRLMPQEERTNAIANIAATPPRDFKDIKRELMEGYKTSPEKRAYDIWRNITGLWHKAYNIKGSDEMYEAWFSFMSENDIVEQEKIMDEAIRNLEKIRARFREIHRERKQIRRVK